MNNVNNLQQLLANMTKQAFSQQESTPIWCRYGVQGDSIDDIIKNGMYMHAVYAKVTLIHDRKSYSLKIKDSVIDDLKAKNFEIIYKNQDAYDIYINNDSMIIFKCYCSDFGVEIYTFDEGLTKYIIDNANFALDELGIKDEDSEVPF